ncbi:DoxX family protein [Chitinophaga sp.]|uniref:DoxX family protein n=1 Tax=Chitinophaga sp. TaxID=1869181 RepID=UPI002F9501C3
MKKRDKIIYWIATLWLALGMTSTGLVQVLKEKKEVEFITQLGYPLYFIVILGVWKILGVIAVLIPRFPLLKEWAYAGFFFSMTGALLSHVASGSALKDMFPSMLLLTLTIVSWLFRPADRKLVSFNFQKSIA